MFSASQFLHALTEHYSRCHYTGPSPQQTNSVFRAHIYGPYKTIISVGLTLSSSDARPLTPCNYYLGHAHATLHNPQFILNNFTTNLGHTIGRMFQTFFPPRPEFLGRQVVTWHNQRDFLFFLTSQVGLFYRTKCRAYKNTSLDMLFDRPKRYHYRRSVHALCSNCDG